VVKRVPRVPVYYNDRTNTMYTTHSMGHSLADVLQSNWGFSNLVETICTSFFSFFSNFISKFQFVCLIDIKFDHSFIEASDIFWGLERVEST